MQRHVPQIREDEDLVTRVIIQLASQFGRYGYRKITGLLRNAGWCVNHKRVERIWRQEGLKVPQKQPKRGRLWLNDGSCVRLRPQYPNHVWAYDFVMDRTHNGRAFRMLTIIDEYTRECLSIVVDRRLRSADVIETLAELFIRRGTPEHIRSDNVLTSKSNPPEETNGPLRLVSRDEALPCSPWTVALWASTCSVIPVLP